MFRSIVLQVNRAALLVYLGIFTVSVITALMFLLGTLIWILLERLTLIGH